MVNYKRYITLSLIIVFFALATLCHAENEETGAIKGKFVFESINRYPHMRSSIHLFKNGNTKFLFDWASSPSWSPDGDRIAISTEKGIQIINENGDVLELIKVPVDRPARVAWSPNGKYIAYTASETDKYSWTKRLYIYYLDTKEHKQILFLDGKYSIITLKWSPQSDRLLFNLSDEKAGLYIINIDGTGFTKLARHGIAMGWFPDGKCIAYDANVDESDNFINKPGLVSIFKMNVDTKEAEEIRKSPFFMETYLSKDGKYIYYCKSADEGGQAIFVSPIDNGTIQTQVTIPTSEKSQDFSPDWYQED